MVLGLSILNAIEPGSSNLGCTDSSACNYDETAIEDDGNCQYDDACGVCGGDNTPNTGTCDCAGTPNGLAITDNCGICVGGNTELEACIQDCDGIWGGDTIIDACGVCGGDNTPNTGTCGCDGQPGTYGFAVTDNCGICDTDPQNNCVQDCSGEWGGELLEDECGVCGGSGIPDGKCDCEGNVNDACGVCNGPGAIYDCGCYDPLPNACDCEGTMPDCLGECGGNAFSDEECTGCMDSGLESWSKYEGISACNYEYYKLINDQSLCVYPDCNGDCSDDNLISQGTISQCSNPIFFSEDICIYNGYIWENIGNDACGNCGGSCEENAEGIIECDNNEHDFIVVDCEGICGGIKSLVYDSINETEVCINPETENPLHLTVLSDSINYVSINNQIKIIGDSFPYIESLTFTLEYNPDEIQITNAGLLGTDLQDFNYDLSYSFELGQINISIIYQPQSITENIFNPLPSSHLLNVYIESIPNNDPETFIASIDIVNLEVNEISINSEENLNMTSAEISVIVIKGCMDNGLCNEISCGYPSPLPGRPACNYNKCIEDVNGQEGVIDCNVNVDDGSCNYVYDCTGECGGLAGSGIFTCIEDDPINDYDDETECLGNGGLWDLPGHGLPECILYDNAGDLIENNYNKSNCLNNDGIWSKRGYDDCGICGGLDLDDDDYCDYECYGCTDPAINLEDNCEGEDKDWFLNNCFLTNINSENICNSNQFDWIINENILPDCLGNCNGTAIVDDCDVCDGNNEAMDCLGDCFGTAYLDNCEQCIGGNTGQIDCLEVSIELYALGNHKINKCVNDSDQDRPDYIDPTECMLLDGIMVNDRSGYKSSFCGENRHADGRIDLNDKCDEGWFEQLNFDTNKEFCDVVCITECNEDYDDYSEEVCTKCDNDCINNPAPETACELTETTGVYWHNWDSKSECMEFGYEWYGQDWIHDRDVNLYAHDSTGPIKNKVALGDTFYVAIKSEALFNDTLIFEGINFALQFDPGSIQYLNSYHKLDSNRFVIERNELQGAKNYDINMMTQFYSCHDCSEPVNLEDINGEAFDKETICIERGGEWNDLNYTNFRDCINNRGAWTLGEEINRNFVFQNIGNEPIFSQNDGVFLASINATNNNTYVNDGYIMYFKFLALKLGSSKFSLTELQTGEKTLEDSKLVSIDIEVIQWWGCSWWECSDPDDTSNYYNQDSCEQNCGDFSCDELSIDYYDQESCEQECGSSACDLLSIQDEDNINYGNNLLPEMHELYQNYPNPFNPNTTISYFLSHSGNVNISIYNIKGQLINTIVDSYQFSGLQNINWNGLNDKGQLVPTGIYIYKLDIGDFSTSKQLVLLK